MTPTATLEPTTLPSTEAETAASAAQAISEILPRKRTARSRVTIILEGDPTQRIVVPAPAFELLVSILAEMANGNGVTVMPVHAELTTQEAANFLNVSRPYLVKLLEEGKIPFRKVGSRRRVQLPDLMAYKAKDDDRRDKALAALAAQAQEEGFGYEKD